MSIKYYVDGVSVYQGGFMGRIVDGFDIPYDPPAGWTEVPKIPGDGYSWDGSDWVPPSAAYLAEKDAADSDEKIQVLEIKGIDRAQFKALLDHENRIRKLENRPEITTQQFKNWVKAQL